jgi:L-seryl-tRNA(Ser) seleniumtransferase
MSSTHRHALLRHLPKIDAVLRAEQFAPSVQALPAVIATACVRKQVELLREKILNGNDSECPTNEEQIRALFESSLLRALKAAAMPPLQSVINATGVVLHTNLGRAPIAKKAMELVTEIATGYSNLEFDLQSGKRGSRRAHLENTLCLLTGAEAALVVNNNAGAIMLALAALSNQTAAAISRSELVEIGGSFRIPEVMRQADAGLHEVGTTNRTHLKDYKEALDAGAKILLKVHQSNFYIEGFTAEVEVQALRALADQYNVPLVVDLGAGCIYEHDPNIPRSELVKDMLRQGADVVTFSGDKLFGSVQAGFAVGKKEIIQQLNAHPLYRALRVDKLSIAAIYVTVDLYLREQYDEIPIWGMLRESNASLQEKSDKLSNWLTQHHSTNLKSESTMGKSIVGGGSLPKYQIPSPIVALTPLTISPQEMVNQLRSQPKPVIATINDEKIVINLRTVGDCDLLKLQESVAHAAQRIVVSHP